MRQTVKPEEYGGQHTESLHRVMNGIIPLSGPFNHNRVRKTIKINSGVKGVSITL